jgi:hypothetical protein
LRYKLQKGKSPDANSSRITYSEGVIPSKYSFSKFIYENGITMKIKPDPALVQTSYLSSAIKKEHQNRMRLSLLISTEHYKFVYLQDFYNSNEKETTEILIYMTLNYAKLS